MHINRGETQDLGPMGPRILHLLKYILKVFKKIQNKMLSRNYFVIKKIRSNLCFQDKNSIFKCVLCSSVTGVHLWSWPG